MRNAASLMPWDLFGACMCLAVDEVRVTGQSATAAEATTRMYQYSKKR